MVAKIFSTKHFLLLSDGQDGVCIFGSTIDGSEVKDGGRVAPVRLSSESGQPVRLTEVPWKPVRSNCVKQSMIELKSTIKELLSGEEAVETADLRVGDFCTISVSKGTFDQAEIDKAFLKDTSHISTARYRNFSKDFRTARGTKDLTDILARNGLTVTVKTDI